MAIIPHEVNETERLGLTPLTERITERLPTILADAWPLLDIVNRFLLCLAAIGVGIRIVTSGNSQLIAVLAAFACAAVVYGLLSPTREE